jgi:hypothetical protein
MRIPQFFPKVRFSKFFSVQFLMYLFLQDKYSLNATKSLAMVLLPYLGIFLLTTGCAFSNPRNRPATSYLDKVVLNPQASTTKKVIAAPLAIPVGLVTLTSDIVLIHPVSSLYPASQDAYKYLWEEPSGGIIFQIFLFVPKVILTPPFILIDTVVRSLFDVGR